MHTLRLTQHSTGENQYKVEITLEGGQFRQSAVSEFEFNLSPQDQESIRWYLEDYPLFRHDPAPKIADRVEKRMAEIGRELFEKVFDAEKDCAKLWDSFKNHLSNARIEVQTEVRDATAVPWEFIRDTNTDTCLALHAAAFVHTHFQPTRQLQPVERGEGPIRILLAICRPDGRNDVPFRSVASQLIKGLSDADRDQFQLDVLRPATYHALNEKLRQAKAESKPYHVVHFDGHGTYDDIMARYSNLPPKNKRGYLLFEHPNKMGSYEYIHGKMLGKTLSENDVPVLLLNACRSAHSEAQEEPIKKTDDDETEHQASGDQTKAFGSLAQEIINEGTAGVVAMRYNVYVVTAAQFVADLYGSLIAGNPLGKAVTLGRKELSTNPIREITGDALALQDWCVPVVYEAGSIALFPEETAEKPLKITLSDSRATPARGHLDSGLPPAPDAGFWGRDETLLALDRAFDNHDVVLLHAYAGSGKTAAVAEFARWYALTGGVEGPVLFTSFEQHKPLARVLDKIGQVFESVLDNSRINWLALDYTERKHVAIQLVQKFPVLWIWDNVEPVAGFPAGAVSAWSMNEQKELTDFLRAARGTKFLLTSRRDEKPWLGDLPVHITLPAMPMHEREQMARGLAENHGRRLRDLKAWRPLLRFTGGNPLTLTVLVRQALRDGLRTEAEMEGFVEKLSRGEAAFEDEESQGRTKSLAASLNYGFENAFSEEERKTLALLYFFQRFLNVKMLEAMGDPQNPAPLPHLRKQSQQTLIPLLDRAAEVGLLTALGDGFYSIHPALPWFFNRLFERFYLEDPLPERAFVEAVAEFGNHYFSEYERGKRFTIALLTLEEPNLIKALRIARAKEWWDPLLSTMQGLRPLYAHTGRRAEWKRLVEEIMPDYVEPATGAPFPGREEQWSMVTQYCALLAMEERNWSKAERLQTFRVEWNRKQAAPYLKMSSETLDEVGRHVIRLLAVSVEQFGYLMFEIGSHDCINYYEEAFKLASNNDDKSHAASCSFNLGNAYLEIPGIRNLENAAKWYARSLELTDERDKLGQARNMLRMGWVSFEKFKEARRTQKTQEELLEHIHIALRHFRTALDLISANAVNDLAGANGELGIIYSTIGELETAIKFWHEAIKYRELQGNFFNAAQERHNIAVVLFKLDRIPDALDYARAALRNFEMYGDRAAAEIEKTKGLIQKLSEHAG